MSSAREHPKMSLVGALISVQIWATRSPSLSKSVLLFCKTIRTSLCEVFEGGEGMNWRTDIYWDNYFVRGINAGQMGVIGAIIPIGPSVLSLNAISGDGRGWYSAGWWRDRSLKEGS